MTGVESTLFPIGRDLFVLTVRVQPGLVDHSKANLFAEKACSLGLSNGGRFNGVMSFKREYMTSEGRTVGHDRMTDAMMAEFPKN